MVNGCSSPVQRGYDIRLSTGKDSDQPPARIRILKVTCLKCGARFSTIHPGKKAAEPGVDPDNHAKSTYLADRTCSELRPECGSISFKVLGYYMDSQEDYILRGECTKCGAVIHVTMGGSTDPVLIGAPFTASNTCTVIAGTCDCMEFRIRTVYASRTPTIGKRMIYNKSPVGGKGE